MTPEQKQELTEKLERVGYSDEFELRPGEDKVLMIYVQDHFICGALYALSMSDKWLESLIDEEIEG